MSALNGRVAQALFAEVASPPHRHVLLLLAMMALEDGSVEASVSDLTRWSGLCERSVNHALAALERGRHLTRYRASGRTALTKIHPRG